MRENIYSLPKGDAKQVIILRGLPASGKSTKALSTIKAHPAGTVARINNDDLCASVFGPGNYVSASKLLAQTRAAILKGLLEHPTVRLIIVDNTNLNPAAIDGIISTCARKETISIALDDSFLDVPLAECIRRDALRANPVGETVIREMSKRI